MSKPPLPCRKCGRKRGEVEFRHRRRYCVECEDAPTQVCKGCGEEKPRSAFHKSRKRHGLRHLCTKCRYVKEREINLRSAKRRHRELQEKVFQAYGGKCACCGEHRRTMLTIDHVNNDGAEHRRQLSKSYKSHKWRDANLGGTKVYADIVKRGFPDDFQLLCANCNASKARNGGVCEHQSEGATTIPQGSRAKRPEAPNTPHHNGVMI